MINWNRVNDLSQEVGPEDFLEVVEIFLEEVEEVIDRLKATADPRSFEVDLHFLKGSALNLGFDGLAALCGDGEKAAQNGEQNSVRLEPVFLMYENSKLEFLSRQNSKSAA